MCLAQDGEVVDTPTSDRADQPFGKAPFCHGEAGATGLSRRAIPALPAGVSWDVIGATPSGPLATAAHQQGQERYCMPL